MKQHFLFKSDLLCGSVWAMFILRLWIADVFTSCCIEDATLFAEWTLPFVAYTVLMRLSLSFMMYRRERRGLYVALVYAPVWVLCLILLPREAMYDAWRDMYNYCMVATNYMFSPRWLTSQLMPYGFRIMMGMLFCCWWVIVPIAYFLINYKRCRLSGVADRWIWSGLYLWKDPLRDKYFGGCCYFLVAWCVGVIMNEWLSLVAMIAVPLLAYRFLNKGDNGKRVLYEYVFIGVVSVLLWLAQYETGTYRNGLLWSSLLLALVSVGGYVLRTKKWVNGCWAFVAVGILLPSFCLGYDVYTVKEAKRVGNFREKYCFTGVLIVEDSEGALALRDRYHLITPLRYSDIRPDCLPFVRVKENGEWKSLNTCGAGYPRGDLNRMEEWQRRSYHFYQIPSK